MRAWLPWILAALIIVALLREISLTAILDALHQADLGLLAGTMMAGALALFVLDARAYPLLFFGSEPPLGASEARSVRGLTYLLAPIHWNVGQAAVAFRLKAIRGLPLVEGAGALLLYQLVSFFALLLLAATGLIMAPHLSHPAALLELSERVSPNLPLGLALIILIAGLALRHLYSAHADMRSLKGQALLRTFLAIPVRHLLLLALLKLAYHSIFAVLFFFGLRAFGVEIPIALVLIATPLIQIAGALPITPAGLGTQQAAMVYLFAARFGAPGSEAPVAAFAFSFPLLLMLLRGCIGLFYLPGWQKGVDA